MNQIKEQWVKVLIDNPQVVGTKGKLGRNNVIFTLSLAYYASKIEQERCFDDMDVFNSSLNYPLSVTEVKRIVKSAYSGKYKGASKTYVQELVSNWGLESLSEEKCLHSKEILGTNLRRNVIKERNLTFPNGKKIF